MNQLRPEAAKHSQRFYVLDAMRGLMLVLITLNHIHGNFFRPLTWQPFGFFSAAEGFVFLSGLLAGYVYGKPGVEGATLRKKIAQRVGIIAIVWLVACTLKHALLHYFAPNSSPAFTFFEELLFLPNPLGIREILGVCIVSFFALHFYLKCLRTGYTLGSYA